MEKLFFNKGLVSGLILLGQGGKARFFQKKCSDVFTQTFLGQKKSPPIFLATIVKLPNNAWVQNNLENLPQ